MAAMVLLHLGFRAWAVLPAFFYVDDYILVDDARRTGLDVSALLVPYDSQFMPFGRLVAWVGAIPSELSWPLLASTSLVSQAIASTACAWMLVSLFGWRWEVLAPLGFYLSSAMTMPGFMWWAAALNQVPLQGVFFAAVAAWVPYLRTRRRRWLVLTVAVLGFGLLCYVKTLFVFPVLAFLALGWFASGGPVRRVATVARRYWPAVLVGVVGGGAFLAYYVSTAPQLARTTRPTGAGELAQEMIGNTFSVALLGGPWRWNEQIAPVAQADAPAWAVQITWVLVALGVVYLALRRERTLRAWALLAGYVAADFVLLLSTRAQDVGAVAGTEYRYLTDATCAVVLAVGLACLPLPGAIEHSTGRATPLLTWSLGVRAVSVAAVLVVASGVWSSWSYARVWHTNHPGERFLTTTLSSVGDLDEVDLARQFLPVDVVGTFNSRSNRTEVVLPLLDRSLVFPATTSALHVVDETGRVVRADLSDGTESLRGPVDGCGWRVTGSSSIPLQGPAVEATWWVRLDFLVSEDTGVTVRTGTSEASLNLRRGLGSTYLEARGPFSAVRLEGLDPGVTLCVDRVLVGVPVPTVLEPVVEESR